MDDKTARELLEDQRMRLGWARAVERERRAEEAEGGIFAELSSADQHQADIGSELFQEELDATIVVMEDERLADVEHALRRLADGSYGTCETCGGVIPDDRLAAEPAARFCITHQRAWELRELNLSVPTTFSPGADTDDERLVLEGLPTDDEGEERRQLSAEEAAMHLEPRPGRTA